jgi:general secretion pathway protein D
MSRRSRSLIRAEFVTVSRNDLEQFGIDWSLARVNLTAGATGFAPRNAPVFVNYATGNLATNLRTLLTQGRGRVVNAPIVTTMNNVPASVFFSTNDWIIIQQTFFDPQGRPIVFSTPYPLFAFSQLQVTPRINADGTITLALAPSITTPGRVQVGAQQMPRFDSQSVLTVRRIKNGETIVIGGLVSRTDSNTIQKVPILGDLPLIGQFFRTKDRAIVENELLIFITATVLEDDPQGGSLAP